MTERSLASHRRSVLRAAIVLTVLVSVAVATLVFVVVRSSAIARSVAEREVPKISELLGREVTTGKIEARILPRPHVRIHDLRVAGAPGEPVTLEAKESEATIALWPLVSSLGRNIQLSSIRLQGVTVTLVRRPDGSWSYADLGKRPAAAAKGPGPPRRGSERTFRMDRFTMSGGQLQIIDRTRRPAASVSLSDVDLQAERVEAGRPLKVDLAACLGAARHNLEAHLRITPLPMSLSALTPENLPALEGTAKVDALELARLKAFLPAQLEAMTSGGKVDATIRVATLTGRGYQLSGTVQVQQAMKGGQPVDGGFEWRTLLPPGQAGTARWEVENLRVNGPGLRLSGTAQVSLRPARVNFALSGPLLDLNALRAGLEAPKRTAARRGPRGNVVITGTLTLGKLVAGKLTATDVSARVKLERGVLTLPDARATVYEGDLRLDGSRVDVTRAKPAWRLRARLDHLNLEQANQQLFKKTPIAGRLTAAVRLRGSGTDWAQIRDQVIGEGTLVISEGALTQADLAASIAEPLSEALRKQGKHVASGLPKGTGGTEIHELHAAFTVKDGWLRLNGPMALSTSFGVASLEGRIGLVDQRLELKGDVGLQPHFVAQFLGRLGGKPSPLKFPIKVKGTLSSPNVAVATS